MGILDILIVVPILAAILIGLGAPARLTAIIAGWINFGLGIYLYFWSAGREVDAYGYLFRTADAKPLIDFPAITWSVGIDGMALVLVLLTVVVTLCALLSISKDEEGQTPKLMYAGSLLIAAGAIGAFVSTDIFFFFAFHELALIPTFLLIGMYGSGERKAAAWKITIYLGLGSLVLLGGLAALVANVGGSVPTFDMVALREAAANGAIAASDQVWIGGLLLIGFGTLVSLFPFHSWAAPAYASAPTPVAMLHAGVLKKFGLYGLLRLAIPLLPEAMQGTWLLNLVLILLLGNILVIGLVTIAQNRLDRIFACSSVMHMGYIFLGIASYNTIGNAGAVLLMFAHGVSIALLFMFAGKLKNALGTLNLSAAGGLAKSAPMFAFCFGIAAFASIGLPGFANFAGEALVFLGAFQDLDSTGFGPLQWATVFAVWGVVISAVYMLRAFRSLFMGELSGVAIDADLTRLRGWVLPAVILIAALLLVGCYPTLFTRFLAPAAEAVASLR